MTSCVLERLERRFRYDIDVKLLENATGARSKTLGVTAWVANLWRGEYQKPFLRSNRLPDMPSPPSG